MRTEKELELIAIGASIASGCQPCTTYHLRVARLSGATTEEIDQAVSDGLAVRRGATEILERLGRRSGSEAGSDAAGVDSESILRTLVWIGAAYAANCVPILETQLAEARRLGTPGEDIMAALKAACAIKSMADKKVHAAAARVLGGSQSGDENGGDECGCGDNDRGEDKPAKPVGGAKCGEGGAEPCSCRD